MNSGKRIVNKALKVNNLKRFQNFFLINTLFWLNFSATAQIISYNYTPKIGFSYTIEILLQKTTEYTAESGKKANTYNIKLIKVTPISNNLYYTGKNYTPTQFGNKCSAGNWTEIGMVHIKSDLPGDVVVSFKSIGEVVVRSFPTNAQGFKITSLDVSENIRDCITEIRNKEFEEYKKNNQVNAPKSTEAYINNSPSNSQNQSSSTNSTPKVTAIDSWNRQVQQDKQAQNQAFNNLGNLLGNLAEEEHREREAKQTYQKQLEAERREKQRKLEMKINNRKNTIAQFPKKDIPLGSMEKALRIYYFVYSYDNLNSEYEATVYISNVFEIGKYTDGTRVYTTIVNDEITGLTPFTEVLHGYYYTQTEAEEMRNNFFYNLKNNGVIIKEVVYKGKPVQNNEAINKKENFWGETEKEQNFAPATIDSLPVNGVTPNNKLEQEKKKTDFWD